MDTSETTIYHAIIICCIVIGTILIYFFVSNIRLRRKILAFQNKRILSEITGLEKERSRIAADFHDELGPMLSAIKMKVQSFELSDRVDLLSQEGTIHHIDEVIHRVRQISFNLMPASLLKDGLIKSLKNYLSFLNGTHNFRFTFIHEAEFKISDEKTVNMYRVLQEIINNSIRHSGGTEINISIRNFPDKICFTLADNGVGFNYKKVLTENKGIGLSSIRNRVKIAGGHIFLSSSENNGSKYKIEIPLKILK